MQVWSLFEGGGDKPLSTGLKGAAKAHTSEKPLTLGKSASHVRWIEAEAFQRRQDDERAEGERERERERE